VADKFGRNYILDLEGSDGTALEIKPPFTLEFSITRNILSSANTASFRIYNLSTDNRNKIRYDQYNWGVFRSIAFFAGYGANNLPTAFQGTVQQGWSVREGTNFVTEIHAYDAGFAMVTGDINLTVPKQTPLKSTLTSIAGTLPKVKVGKIGNYNTSSKRGNSHSGNTMDVLTTLSGGGAFIDNGTIHILQDNEVIQGAITAINSASGLLGTPILQDTFLTFDMIFEPRLLIGQLISLDSITAANFNGNYKVIGIKHQGTISAAICGDAKTSVSLAYGISPTVVP
jgi:hypothetical protein